MGLPGTIWYFRVLTRVPYLWQAEAPKEVLGSTFSLRVWGRPKTSSKMPLYYLWMSWDASRLPHEASKCLTVPQDLASLSLWIHQKCKDTTIRGIKLRPDLLKLNVVCGIFLLNAIATNKRLIHSTHWMSSMDKLDVCLMQCFSKVCGCFFAPT